MNLDEIFVFQIPTILSEDEQFKEGQKLEAVDPLEMSRICPATIGKVNQKKNNKKIFDLYLIGIKRWLFYVIS